MKETAMRFGAYMQNVNSDWISGLPDELLARVLSFLTTKEAVQTCVLSKRWTRVWANLPILKFNINEFRVDDSTGGADEALRKSIARFDQFVNGVVENLESTHVDRVCYVRDIKPAYFYIVPVQWLHRVALLMPNFVDISVAGVKSLELPDSLFSCATLQHLKIELIQVLKTPVISASINLPSLKVFDVKNVELPENFTQNLFMGCPSLATLNLSSCKIHFSSISSNMLSALDIFGCNLYGPIQISCPSLLSLHVCSYLMSGADISLNNMKSLMRADIGLCCMAQHASGGDLPVLNFLGGLSNATKLSLYLQSPELKAQLERDILNCRNLNNLDELVISMWTMSFDFNLLASLLKLSPNVKKLSLRLDVGQGVIQNEHRQGVLGEVMFQHKFIETVKLCDLGLRKLPQVLIKTLMEILNSYIKEIGNVIIQ